MPIVHRPTTGAPLTQGDILRDVAFAVTRDDGTVSADNTAKFVLVTSRPCNALRDKAITVAPVVAWPIDLPALLAEKAANGLDRARRVLAAVRDGGQLSDRFYLGPLEDGSNRRYSAQLGTLSTVILPVDGPARSKWIDDRRIWRLDSDLARDLHVRLFNTQARLGFDDEGWLPDVDLDYLITQGELELAECQKEAAATRLSLQEKEAVAGHAPEQFKSSAAKRDEAVRAAKERLAPYLAERSRREPPSES